MSRMFCIYRCFPEHVVFELAGDGTCIQQFRTRGPRWPYGEIRGGTPPVPYEGNLLRFFHSSIRNEPWPPHHRYFLGAYLMEPTPPFTVTAISRKPILYGSELPKVDCFHFKPNVVFPGGVVVRDGHWLLSVGINDCECAIVKIKPENLNL